jgi:hypothetical protein
MQLRPDPDKDLLRQIFGFGAVGEYSQTERIDPADMTTVEHFKGTMIS